MDKDIVKTMQMNRRGEFELNLKDENTRKAVMDVFKKFEGLELSKKNAQKTKKREDYTQDQVPVAVATLWGQ
ncbi:hypothetical protein [uncultured Shewanella sp.]|uniref:hypothetical protein n=1 Tax=uncultured Shewanella sp. TaxID=173975 RepID=UPI0026071FCD|nr:hypothetical protein [uncultured Shewanella sp.]